MKISKTSNSPNFQAKMIIIDKRIQRFIKSSFTSNSKETFSSLDKFTKIYPDTVVTVAIKNEEGKNYMVAKNCTHNTFEKKLMHDTETVKLEDQTLFLDLIKKAIGNKAFWEK